jgi:hypothetical protein
VRTRLVPLLVAPLLLAGGAPASGLDLNSTLELDVPVFSSGNVRLVGAVPSALAISTAFSTDSPHMYVNTLRGIEVYDISNPRLPLLVGYEPTLHFQNEVATKITDEDVKQILARLFPPKREINIRRKGQIEE